MSSAVSVRPLLAMGWRRICARYALLKLLWGSLGLLFVGLLPSDLFSKIGLLGALSSSWNNLAVHQSTQSSSLCQGLASQRGHMKLFLDHTINIWFMKLWSLFVAFTYMIYFDRSCTCLDLPLLDIHNNQRCVAIGRATQVIAWSPEFSSGTLKADAKSMKMSNIKVQDPPNLRWVMYTTKPEMPTTRTP